MNPFSKKPKFLKTRVILLIFLFTIFNEFLFLADHTGRISLKDLLAKVSPIELTELTNDRREEAEVNTLTVDPRLIGAAKLKADHMAENGYFAHISPEGVEPWHWFDEAGYEYQYAGENLAVNFSESYQVDEAWMNSPLHRKNIINENFEDIGIATAQGEYKGKEATFVVQLFGKKRSQYARMISRAEEVAEEQQIAQEGTSQEDVLGEETQNLFSVKSEEESDTENQDQEVRTLTVQDAVEEPTPETSEERVETANLEEPKEESFALISKEDNKNNLLTGTLEEVIKEKNAKSEYVSFWSRATASARSLAGYLFALTLIISFGTLGINKGFNEDLRLPDVLANETIVVLAVFSALLTQHYLLQIATTLL
jgi:hypothetical protein